ncbi:MAG TPA: hypothetical protein DCL15_11310 [Chloroflexi bacterium]|nr:hypothetical protein [Chloroflexota bacterium]HHW88640.1 DUF4013 domain-containing protein [Chloroflexota bacterium]
MDFVKALTFITEDPRWKEKVAIGSALALLSFLIVPLVITLGYCVRLTQNMRDGKQFPLPEWDDWSGDLVRGFKLAVVWFIWALPLFLVSIPMTIGGIMTDSDSAVATTLGVTIVVGASCLTALYGIFITLMTPGFTLWYARDEEIRSGLQLSDIFQWTRAHVTDVILFTLAYIVASFVISTVAGIVGVLLCIVGLIITVPVATFVTYIYQFNLLGQIAFKDSTGRVYYPPAAAPVAPSAPPVQPPASREDDAPQG